MSQDRTAEILNYLSAMSRDIGEFRQEFKQFRTETNARLDKIEARLDALETRVGALESEMKEVKQGLASVRREIQIQTKKMEAIMIESADTRARLTILENRFDALEGKQEQSK